MKRIIGLFILLMIGLHSYAQTKPIELPEGYTFPYWPENNYLGVSDLGTIQEQPWVNSDHVVDGWDWSFPSFVEPSPRSLLGLQRITTLNKSFEPVNLQFKANSIGILWVDWRDLEPTMGNYDFSKVKSRIEQANRSGSDIILRILGHARGNASNPTGGQAPLWLDDLGVDYAQSTGNNLNYNPLHPAFHDRYIKLINKMAEEGIPDLVEAAYVGWASPSYGDEGIGPYHDDVQKNATVPEVIERIDTWAEAFKGQENKVFMGAPLHYGFDKGFGVRRGFVEMYLYQIPNTDLGQYIDQDGYLIVDESSPIIDNKGFHGEVNEEYGDGFVSGDNPFILYRFGYTTDGFPYRYFMSSLRTLQMRCTYTHIEGQLVPQMLPFIARELGRTVEDAPSVWSFLNTTYMAKSNYANNDDRDPPRTFTQTEIDQGIEMKNFERWLYQRDAPGYETTPAVKILHAYKQWMVQNNKHYDYIARSGKKMGFDVDDRWTGIEDSVAIKVSYFDNYAGEMNLLYNDGSGVKTKTHALTGDEGLKTVTFFVPNIASNEMPNNFDFVLEAGANTENIVVSMVRLVHADVSAGQMGTFSLNTNAANGSILLDPPGGNYFPGEEVTVTAVGDLGYGFDSWSGDLSGTENSVTITMNSDKTISANFVEVVPVALNVDAQNGSVILDPPGGVYNPGTEVTLSVEANSGYGFRNWSGDLTGSAIPATIIMDGEKAVTANFAKAYGINLGAEDGTSYKASDGMVYTGLRTSWAANDLGNVVAGTNDPELFTTWTVVPRNTDYIRNFSMAVENGAYQVTLMTSEHDSYYAQPGKRVTDISYEDSMYHPAFDTWDAVGAMNTALEIVDIVTVDDGELNVVLRKVGDVWDDVPIFHAFKAVKLDEQQATYNLVTAADGSGIVERSPFGDSFYEGFEVTLTAVPDEGYKFNGWSGSYNGLDNPAKVIMDSDKDITAQFTAIPTYTLSTTATNGSVAVSPAGATHYEGTEVTLTATPDEGYEFSGWSGDLSGLDNPATITMDDDKEVTASFTLIPTYALSVTSENGAVAMDPVGGIYERGTSVTLTATPDEGYEFFAWGGDLNDTINPTTIYMSGDKDVIAAFIMITGVNSVEDADNVIIYPNPVTDKLYFEFDEDHLSKEISIYKNPGLLIYETKTNSKSTSIDIQSLNIEGLIFIQVKTVNKKSYHKIIIL